MRMAIAILFAGLTGLVAALAVPAGPARAQAQAEPEAQAQPGDCPLTPEESVRVARVIDGDTVVLEDGRTLRLVAALAPKAGFADSDRTERALGGAATAALADIVGLAGPADDAGRAGVTAGGATAGGTAAGGAELALAYGGTRQDRHGRLLAQAFVAGDPARWVQGLMVDRGLARAYSLVDNYRCVAVLLQREALARDAGLGLWATDYGSIRKADRPDRLAGEIGRFVIVEGRVISVGERPRRTYLNFGTYWGNDFTVFVDRADLDGFATAETGLGGLDGRNIRVRGWIREDRGPAIHMTRPEQLELVE